MSLNNGFIKVFFIFGIIWMTDCGPTFQTPQYRVSSWKITCLSKIRIKLWTFYVIFTLFTYILKPCISVLLHSYHHSSNLFLPLHIYTLYICQSKLNLLSYPRKCTPVKVRYKIELFKDFCLFCFFICLLRCKCLIYESTVTPTPLTYMWEHKFIVFLSFYLFLNA